MRSIALLCVLAIGCDDCGERDGPEPVSAPLPAAAGLRSVADFADIEDDAERSTAIFEELGKVLLHPRCVNCHPAGERPTQGEGMPHQPLVVRGEDGHGAPGMECATCHGEANYLNVPGNPKWHLAPLQMAWEGKSVGEICAQLTDESRNGDMSPEEMVEHIAHDDLVAYGWNPPAHLPPAPGNQALAGQLMQAFFATGAHCPEP